jgi:hypothetical protein
VQQLATTEPIEAPEPHKPGKPARISARIRRVAELMITGECKTVKAACERVGIHPDYAYRELKKPQVQVFIEQRARQTIAAGTMRASARLVELMDASSEHVSADVSRHVLAIANIRPPETGANININNSISVGYVIDIAPQQGTARTIEHEAQNDAT